MKKISVILPSLENGGAERLHIYLANEWIKENYKIDFIILKNKNQLIDLLDKRIKIKIINVNKIRYSFFYLFYYFIISRTNIVVCAMWPLTSITLIAKKLSFSKAKIFTVDHCPYSNNYSKDLNIPNNKLFGLIRFTYPLANKNIVVSEAIKKEFIKYANIDQSKIYTINNGIYYKKEDLIKNNSLKKKLFNINDDVKCIVSIGNLKPQKNFLNLIKATQIVLKNNYLKLFIIGDGIQYNILKEYIYNNKLQNKIFLLGYKNNVMPYLVNSDIYVNSSDYDGFPLVLIEALISGTNIVSTDCESGPSEILENGKLGKLVPVKDTNALAFAIEDTLNNKINKNINNSKNIDKYDIHSVSKNYMKLF